MRQLIVFIQRLAILCVIVMGLAAPTLSVHAANSSPSPEIQKLSDLILLRLSLMEPVAAYKWLNGIPVADARREMRVVAVGKGAAEGVGLDPQTIEPFIRQQMEIAKAVQHALIDGWEQETRPVPTTVPDLADVTRPAIIAVTSDILIQLERVLPMLRDSRTRPILVGDLTDRAAGYGLRESDFRRLVDAAASVDFD